MSKLEQRRGQAKRAFNGDRARSEGKRSVRSGQGKSPKSAKPDFDRAVSGKGSAGKDKPALKLDREPSVHLKKAGAALDKQPGRKVIRRPRTPGLER